MCRTPALGDEAEIVLCLRVQVSGCVHNCNIFPFGSCLIIVNNKTPCIHLEQSDLYWLLTYAEMTSLMYCSLVDVFTLRGFLFEF